jgi:hypothetical protein
MLAGMPWLRCSVHSAVAGQLVLGRGGGAAAAAAGMGGHPGQGEGGTAPFDPGELSVAEQAHLGRVIAGRLDGQGRPGSLGCWSPWSWRQMIASRRC